MLAYPSLRYGENRGLVQGLRNDLRAASYQEDVVRFHDARGWLHPCPGYSLHHQRIPSANWHLCLCLYRLLPFRRSLRLFHLANGLVCPVIEFSRAWREVLRVVATYI